MPWRRPLLMLLHGTLLVGLVLFAAKVYALEFTQVQTNESAVNFDFTQMGVTLDGKFNRFSAQIAFDPAQPAKAKASIDIDIASIDTGSDEANKEVVRDVWFDTASHPSASFVSSSIKALDGSRYQASGKLTIKGKTRDVSVPVSFQPDGARGVLNGAFTIKRLDYGIGEGEWADTGTVADEVQIRFHLVVNAATGRK